MKRVTEQQYKKALETIKAFETQEYRVKVIRRRKGDWTASLNAGDIITVRATSEKDLYNVECQGENKSKYWSTSGRNEPYYSEGSIILKKDCMIVPWKTKPTK